MLTLRLWLAAKHSAVREGAQGSMCGNRDHRRIDPPTKARAGQLERPHAESHVRTGRPKLTSRANAGAASDVADPGRADGGFYYRDSTHPACNLK